MATPTFLEGKVLVIPSLKDVDGNSVSTGKNQYEACIDMIEKWNIRDVIVAMCFDTTSTNTGCHKGTCKRIESDYLGRKIFWMGCRHHISELLLKASWHSKFEEDSGPITKAFENVKEVWPELDISSVSPFKKISVRSPILTEMKTKAVTFYNEILSVKNRNDSLPRDDYRTLAETSLMLLGGSPPGGICWKRPGAMHKARFMAKKPSLHSDSLFSSMFLSMFLISCKLELE